MIGGVDEIGVAVDPWRNDGDWDLLWAPPGSLVGAVNEIHISKGIREPDTTRRELEPDETTWRDYCFPRRLSE